MRLNTELVLRLESFGSKSRSTEKKRIEERNEDEGV